MLTAEEYLILEIRIFALIFKIGVGRVSIENDKNKFKKKDHFSLFLGRFAAELFLAGPVLSLRGLLSEASSML
jgi:hypothetical protein